MKDSLHLPEAPYFKTQAVMAAEQLIAAVDEGNPTVCRATLEAMMRGVHALRTETHSKDLAKRQSPGRSHFADTVFAHRPMMAQLAEAVNNGQRHRAQIAVVVITMLAEQLMADVQALGFFDTHSDDESGETPTN